jgi:hypothetical protein
VFEMLEQQRTYQLSGGIYSRQKIMFTFKKIVIQPQNLRRRSSANSKKNLPRRTSFCVFAKNLKVLKNI